MLKTYRVHIKDNTYFLRDKSIDSLMDYLVRVCGNNINDITIKEI